MTLVVRCDDRAALAVALGGSRGDRAPVAFVPTMGALHEGHRALVERAATLAPTVVVSIFVNPTQFDAATDLATYPRTLSEDLALLEEVAGATGVRVVAYVPSVHDVYPDGAVATVHVPEVTVHLCGARRPGHFDGVATVVDALLRAVRPTVMILGRKDFQQLVVVRALVEQAGHDVVIDAAPTVRADDGVAISSRNTLLAPDGRMLARRIPRALAAGVALVAAARAAGSSVETAALRSVVVQELTVEGLRIDYVDVVDPLRIVPVEGSHDPELPLLLAVAVHVGDEPATVRLIDNVLLGDREDELRLLRASAAGRMTGNGS